jgi:YfiH family protein
LSESVIRSRLLSEHGLLHGFSTRLGGVSAPPFDSLNLGRAVGDDARAVAENHRRLAHAIGYDVARLYETSQVHGASVREIAIGEDVARVRAVEADALIARASGDAVGVRTADCVPILIADVASGAVSAVHAGWRGVVGGVISVALRALAARDPICAIGPHIRVASFEVGEDVASEIAAAVPGVDVVDRRRARPHVDLARAVVAQLEALGVARDRIDDVGGDTSLESQRFHSHRRDGARSGRHLSVIVAR